MRKVCLLLCFMSSLLHAQTWTQLPDFPGTARDDAASFTIGSRIYVGTGMDAGFQLMNDWWCFDKTTETWTAIASLPTTPRQYGTGFTIVDTGYVFGGVDANGALDQLWAYHPESDTWEQKNPMPAEARFACVAVTGFYWNAIVATGMLASGVPTNEAWKYQAQTDTWEAIAPVPGPARHRASCFLDGAGMLVAGGADSTFSPLSDVWSYPIWFETGEWYPQTALPFPRFSADGSWGSARMLIGGATGQTSADVHADVLRYDLSDWPSLPDFPAGARRGGVASGEEVGWISMVYYGTGSDNGQRYRDWWKLEFPVGIATADMSEFTMSPVPANAILQVTTSTSDNWSSWQVWSIDSRLVAQGSLARSSTTIPSASLPSGTYILRLAGIHGTASKRFTVAH